LTRSARSLVDGETLYYEDAFWKLFTDPARRGREVLIEVDPISGKESEQYPNAYPKEYRESVENFREIISGGRLLEISPSNSSKRQWRGCSPPMKFAVVADLTKLKELKHRIVHLFLYANDTGRNHWD
jgi:hypothetical protein